MEESFATTKESRKTILCVLSEEQRNQYLDEFRALEHPRIDFVFDDDPDRALDRMAELHPSLVIVGMEVGRMEGVEFVAWLMGRYRTFRQKVIVLPEKGDPFPPAMQSRDPTTGRSKTENIDLATLSTVVKSIAADETAAPTADDVRVSDESLARPRTVKAVDIGLSFAAGPPPVEDDTPAAQEASKMAAWYQRRWVWAAAVLTVLVLAVVAYAMKGSNGSPAKTPAAESSTAPAPAAATAPDVEPAGEATGNVPGAGQALPAAAKVASSGEQGLMALPLRFDAGKSSFHVIDEGELDRQLASVRRTLRDQRSKRLEVGGHTSAEGGAERNRTLGLARAQAVRDLLLRKDFRANQLSLVSYGSTDAMTASTPEEARRVTLRVIESKSNPD